MKTYFFPLIEGMFFFQMTGYCCFKGILATPPKATPPSNKGLIRPYFLGVALGGVARIPMIVLDGKGFKPDALTASLPLKSRMCFCAIKINEIDAKTLGPGDFGCC